MGPQHEGLGALGIELAHDAVPQHPAGAHLGDFQVEVHAHRPEEGQTAGEGVHIEAGGDAGAHVFHAVGQGEGQFDGLVGPGFLDVITRDGNRVELGHVLRGVAEDVGDDLHRRLGRIDIGVADHELLQDVVLDGAGQLFLGDALLFGGDDVAGQDGQHGAVHGHGNGNLVEGDAVEEDLHVLDGIDGHAGLADVAQDPGIVRVVAAVGGQVEGHGDALTTGGQGLAVEGVGFFGGGEAGVLADGPRPHGVHGGLGTAQIGSEAGQGVGVGQILHVLLGVQGLDGQAFRRDPVERIDVAAGSGLGGGLGPGVQVVGIGQLGLGCVGRHVRPFSVHPPHARGAATARFSILRRPNRRRGRAC